MSSRSISSSAPSSPPCKDGSTTRLHHVSAGGRGRLRRCSAPRRRRRHHRPTSPRFGESDRDDEPPTSVALRRRTRPPRGRRPVPSPASCPAHPHRHRRSRVPRARARRARAGRRQQAMGPRSRRDRPAATGLPPRPKRPERRPALRPRDRRRDGPAPTAKPQTNGRRRVPRRRSPRTTGTTFRDPSPLPDLVRELGRALTARRATPARVAPLLRPATRSARPGGRSRARRSAGDLPTHRATMPVPSRPRSRPVQTAIGPGVREATGPRHADEPSPPPPSSPALAEDARPTGTPRSDRTQPDLLQPSALRPHRRKCPAPATRRAPASARTAQVHRSSTPVRRVPGGPSRHPRTDLPDAVAEIAVPRPCGPYSES